MVIKPINTFDTQPARFETRVKSLKGPRDPKIEKQENCSLKLSNRVIDYEITEENNPPLEKKEAQEDKASDEQKTEEDEKGL